jgi:hypothetical protein
VYGQEVESGRQKDVEERASACVSCCCNAFCRCCFSILFAVSRTWGEGCMVLSCRVLPCLDFSCLALPCLALP